MEHNHEEGKGSEESKETHESHESPEPKVKAPRKPFHKHVAHHFRKAHRRVTKYLYERDTIFATLWIFIFILVVKFFPLHNVHFFDPVEIALEDFDFNDIAYSKLNKTGNNKLDTNIVVINIGEADREGIAELINKTASYNPRVIGLDVTFDGERDPHKDSLMREAVEKNKNLVIADRFYPGKGKVESEYTSNFFTTTSTKSGYVNFFSKEWATIRVWNPFFNIKQKDTSTTYSSFVSSIIKIYDPVKYEKLKKRTGSEIINYSRRYTESVKQYFVIPGEELLERGVDSSAIRGKIALLAFVDLSPENIEDKKYTPMNEEFAGKSIPDMNGIFVHANIISMVLENKFIKKLPLWFTILAAILIGWLHMSFFIHYYLESHIWFHLVAKLAQLLSAVFFVYLGMYLFSRYRIKLDMSLTIIVIVLAVDIIYFYEAFATWIHKKFGYKTVFHQKHH